MMMVDIAVIGTASLDVLRLASGQTVQAAGGAGLYTALAAAAAGCRVTLLAPKPRPMPPVLAAAAARLEWLGPEIALADLPRLEIAHHGGGRATLVSAAWGAEAQLTPADLPAAVKTAQLVHIAALSTAGRQLDFLRAVRAEAGPGQRVSVGTYARLVWGEPALVRRLLAEADLFFMNENEAGGLFGSVDLARSKPGGVLFVTQGQAGARLVDGAAVTVIPAQPAVELDPTGAGDTFCGAVLAGLAQGQTPAAAARLAVRWAAKTVGAVGPAALLGTS